MKRLGRVVVALLAVIGVLSLSGLGAGFWLVSHMSSRDAGALPAKALLTLDLEARFHDGADDPLASLSGERSYSLRQVVEGLERAAVDAHVTGLFATLGHASLGLAEAQELRDAVSSFRATGKPAVLFAETLGEGGGGTLDAYLATAFSEIWLQPSGEVGLTGLMAEAPFLKGALDMLGIRPQFMGRHEYKSAIETFTETGFSVPHRENLGRLLDSLHEQVVAGIAAGRGLPVETAQALVGKGPFLPKEALAAGLVDHVGYRDEALKSLVASGAEELDVADYAAGLPDAKGVKVALIQGRGAIHRGEAARGLGAEPDFGAQTIAEAFREAMEDEAVKAILFRVDSPGGSYTASDTVWNEVRRARDAGKPVVVSMGNMAASGGYFVAMGANRIVAEPATITGSIGVFSGKMVMEEFWKKLGISWDAIQRGDNAAMWSMNQPFTPEGKARMNALLDAIYDDFTAKAQSGRGLDGATMDKLARGRIWTGADAKAHGLVDALGGWGEAKVQLREAAGLSADAELRLVEFPRPRKPWELVAEALAGAKVSEARHLAVLARAAALIEPVMGPLAEARAGQPLRLPGTSVRP